MTLWGFFHTDCIYESAHALVSLHHSKAGAYRAMNRAQWAAWWELQTAPRPPRHWGYGRKRGAKAYIDERSHIGAVEVQP